MEKLWVVDFGSQYSLLIVRRARELGVYAELLPWNRLPEAIPPEVRGIIFSGSHASASEGPPLPESWIGQRPSLAICYSAQWLAAKAGGAVAESHAREYGPAQLELIAHSPLWRDMPVSSRVWMSHSDTIIQLPRGAKALARTADIPYAAYEIADRSVYAVQFHPEVAHTEAGATILRNFLYEICGFKGDWRPEAEIDSVIASLQRQMPDGHAIGALSGGIDSTVAALLVHRAIGERFHGVFVDTGLLRAGEVEAVLNAYQQVGLPVQRVCAEKLFLSALNGITDPELKRKTIGRLFIEVFEKEAQKLPEVRYLVQGTIYPDVVESGTGVSATIKSHHNVGGLPEKLALELVEPLRLFFKDEVRALGRKLGLPEAFLRRHPFPGPGLAVRILGEITPERVNRLRQADAIFLQVLEAHGWYDRTWQAFAVLLPQKSVGVAGDQRRYGETIALRAVNSTDGMTADPTALPQELLFEAARRILAEVPNVVRVVYDLSTKPPATIEWE
ncbi:MAG: glutamine-hydrolyzing GMP synthase [Bacteroidia bacterium]|nr:glutamine-hydrolyzing GMP synthase [Bacteroidia bacterium]MCX7651485.1 glutamine-hydrolyzing GMP synthase [Bacteroidia bacterium]MDW8416760.1 glutamine-hydrolyzing GMP synthase [Bacteroidia bacterium]